MLTYETFIAMLMTVSLLTSLIVQAIKMVLDGMHKSYQANLIAGVVAVFLGVTVPIAYVTWTGAVIESTPKLVVFILALMVGSWLSAMVGYDKVVQTLKQITTYE